MMLTDANDSWIPQLSDLGFKFVLESISYILKNYFEKLVPTISHVLKSLSQKVNFRKHLLFHKAYFRKLVFKNIHVSKTLIPKIYEQMIRKLPLKYTQRIEWLF